MLVVRHNKRPPSISLLKQAASLLFTIFMMDALPAASKDYFADNGYAKPLSTMQHPSAECFQGVTYIAYQGPQESPFVCAFSHATKQWTGPVRAGVSSLSRSGDSTDPDDADNHGRPALMVDQMGFIHLIFGGHGGSPALGGNHLGTPGTGRQTHVVSKRPKDITEWETLDNISPNGTYSQLVKMSDGDIYLFYRHGSHRSDWVYQKSTDNARTFAPPISILKSKPTTTDPNICDAWYAWFDKGKGDTIVVTYNHHPCAIIGHRKTRNNGYFMTVDCADDTWTNVHGQRLTLPVTKESADRETLVLKTGREGLRTGICHVDPEGHPHIFYRQGKGQIRYYRWTGQTWQGPSVITTESQSQDADFSIESSDEIKMLVSQTIGSKGEVAWWKSNNAGRSWSKDIILITAESTDYLVGSLVRNAHSEARVVVSELKHGQANLYRKMFLIGDHGPVKRE